MQKAETGLLPKQEDKKPDLDLTKLADIAIGKDNKVYVNWPVDKKELVLVGLGEAIKLIATYKADVIVKPQPKFLDFVKGIKH